VKQCIFKASAWRIRMWQHSVF